MIISKSSPADEKGRLTYHWIMAGIVSSATRFIPVPFVDDVIRNRCRRYVVAKTLAAHGAESHIQQLRPYIDSDAGWLAFGLAIVTKVPLKLLLFPVRKIVSVLTSVRGVPLEITRMVLLGRTLDRILRTGDVPTAAQAMHMRIAFEAAFARMDFRTIKAAINDSLEQVGDWKDAAITAARRLLGSSGDPETADLSNDPIATSPQVTVGAKKIDLAMKEPATLQLFDEFDSRFNSEFAKLRLVS